MTLEIYRAEETRGSPTYVQPIAPVGSWSIRSPSALPSHLHAGKEHQSDFVTHGVIQALSEHRTEFADYLRAYSGQSARNWKAELLIVDSHQIPSDLSDAPIPEAEIDAFIVRTRRPIAVRKARIGAVEKSRRPLCLSEEDLAAFGLCDAEPMDD